MYLKDVNLNSFKTSVEKNLIWHSKMEDVESYPDEGYYFFKRSSDNKIVYVGVGGLGEKKKLKNRLKQYYTPRDKGTRYFKLKALGTILNESKWDALITGDELNNWRNYMESNYEFSFIKFEPSEENMNDNKKRALLIGEAALIGAFNPEYNY